LQAVLHGGAALGHGTGRYASVLTLAAVFASIAFVSSAAAQYEVTWCTIDGGGVMDASGGGYGAKGTIGQHDAGKLSGGGYAVSGGFWVFGGGAPTLVTPELPTDPEHRVLKNRYISIDPATNPGVDTVIKVEVAEMRRCQNAPTRGCITDTDCDDVCDDISGDPPYHTLKCPPANCGDTVPPSVCIDSGPCVDLAETFRSLRSWIVQQPIQDPTGGCKKPGCPPRRNQLL
jgi:hypothetical protein